MAHDIASFDGIDHIAYIDDTPWHSLGTNVLGRMRDSRPDQYVDVALDAAGMRYTVGSEPLFLADGTQAEMHRASVRYDVDGKIAALLSVVGKDYKHVQNERAIDICRVLATSHGCVPAAAGILGHGERAWMLMRLADATITPVPGDDSRGYFLLYWGHDGDLALTGRASLIRAICQNTINVAIASGSKAFVKIRHTTSADSRVDEAARLMGDLMATLTATGETFAHLARHKMDAVAVAKFIERVIPATVDKAGKVSGRLAERRSTIARLAVVGRGAEMANQLMPAGYLSAWGLVNAVTEYWDHVRPAEAGTDSAKASAVKSAIFGEANDVKAQALIVARELVLA